MSPASSSGREPLAAIFGLAGTALSAAERNLFRDADPLGFILFQRNCENPDQVRELVARLRDCVDRGDAPVLIDQEGGRVARLRPPHWREYPAAATLAAVAQPRAAVFLAARLIAHDLATLGITVDCAPVLDLAFAGTDPVIGDRAYGANPATVAELGRAACEGLLAGGVLPIIKHIPGHGRATVDSHKALPVVTASRRELDETDFAPFRALNGMPWAMTAHIVYRAIDPDRPATLSPRLIGETIRASIGFDGMLISDDLSMAALPGTLAERAKGALDAGCDVVLHCNGNQAEMMAIAASIGPLTPAARRRLARGEAQRRVDDRVGSSFDREAAVARLAALIGMSE
ncbi:MAG: beta-N-acetylhexosaminidase [Alphaproteobacteria bacterium]|nr:beta-N-acetylhexosaminidase [Alphaproteobacteria bacterium]